MKKIMYALAELAGVAAVTVGVWQIYEPAAFIVAGAAAVVAVEVRS